MVAGPEAEPHVTESLKDEEDEFEADVMALVVVDEFPIKTINKIIEDNEAEMDVQYIWLADSYDTLPDANPPRTIQGTHAPISDEWRSPFIGQSLRQVANFIRDAPAPPKPIDKEYCAVLRKEDYENDAILICKIPPEGGDDNEPQTIVTDPERLGSFFIGFNRSEWDVTYLNGER